MIRAWINQPSTLQDGHRFDGLLVLAEAPTEDSRVCTVWPRSGETVSMRIPRIWISAGWPAHLINKAAAHDANAYPEGGYARWPQFKGVRHVEPEIHE